MGVCNDIFKKQYIHSNSKAYSPRLDNGPSSYMTHTRLTMKAGLQFRRCLLVYDEGASNSFSITERMPTFDDKT
jgi:hypothetical protein